MRNRADFPPYDAGLSADLTPRTARRSPGRRSRDVSRPDTPDDGGKPLGTSGIALGRARALPEEAGEPEPFSGVLHELREPLTAVLGYVRLLEGERAGPISETQRRYLRVILENSQRMVEALDSLSALAARRRRRCVLVDFGDVWNESVRLTRLRAAIKGIRIVQRPPEEGLIVSGDRDDLAFAAHKILANAVKATAPGGTIELQLARDSSEVTARLTNAEAGVAEEGQTAMLGCCRWSGCPTQSGEESAATGMPLVHDIIETHAGRISSTGSPESGWTLTISLPATHRDS